MYKSALEWKRTKKKYYEGIHGATYHLNITFFIFHLSPKCCNSISPERVIQCIRKFTSKIYFSSNVECWYRNLLNVAYVMLATAPIYVIMPFPFLFHQLINIKISQDLHNFFGLIPIEWNYTKFEKAKITQH